MRINFLVLLFQCLHRPRFATIETEFYLINFSSSLINNSQMVEKKCRNSICSRESQSKKDMRIILSIFISFPHHQIEALKILSEIIIINNSS